MLLPPNGSSGVLLTVLQNPLFHHKNHAGTPQGLYPAKPRNGAWLLQYSVCKMHSRLFDTLEGEWEARPQNGDRCIYSQYPFGRDAG